MYFAHHVFFVDENIEMLKEKMLRLKKINLRFLRVFRFILQFSDFVPSIEVDMHTKKKRRGRRKESLENCKSRPNGVENEQKQKCALASTEKGLGGFFPLFSTTWASNLPDKENTLFFM